MKSATSHDILEHLAWRAAIKKFDVAKKVDQEKVDTILEAGRLSPSSSGTQPWKFIVITNPELREKLRAAGSPQAQIVEASHLIVIAHQVPYTPEHVQIYMQKIADVRGVALSTLDGFKNTILTGMTKKTPEQLEAWTARQAYIALGMMIETAALLEVDAGPMEGFNTAAFDEILGLKEQGLKSVVLLALGYRSSEDKYSNQKKVRFDKDDVIVEIK